MSCYFIALLSVWKADFDQNKTAKVYVQQSGHGC